MHLMHPAFSLSGKRKGKQKFRNADEARKARELAEQWEQNQLKWKAMSKPVTGSVKSKPMPSLSPEPGRTTIRAPSLNLWITGPVNVKQSPQYTGNKIIGIGTMHKSNAVPIFTEEQAKDISTMRR